MALCNQDGPLIFSAQVEAGIYGIDSFRKLIISHNVSLIEVYHEINWPYRGDRSTFPLYGSKALVK